MWCGNVEVKMNIQFGDEMRIVPLKLFAKITARIDQDSNAEHIKEVKSCGRCLV